ncbi:MAG: biopolymer transporter ExbD [Acidobacteriota bacterium]
MGVELGAGEAKSEPNVVPLCDVLLVLLIIFMVVTPMLQKGVDVRLPEAANTVGQPDPANQIVVAIKFDGSIYLNQEQVNENNLKPKIEELFENRTDKTLYLKADAELDYGSIVKIMNIIREAGIEILGIVTEQKAHEEID